MIISTLTPAFNKSLNAVAKTESPSHDAWPLDSHPLSQAARKAARGGFIGRVKTEFSNFRKSFFAAL